MRELDEFSWLPGVLTWDAMTVHQYKGLSRFHYIPGDPPQNSRYFGVWYSDDASCRAVGVLVLSYPPVASLVRDVALQLNDMYPEDKLRWVNANVKTISRVIIHPQFRGVGLARTMVQELLQSRASRVVEAFAVMERAVPFFRRAGMHFVEPPDADKPCYMYFRDSDVLGERGGGGRKLTVPQDKPPFPSQGVLFAER